MILYGQPHRTIWLDERDASVVHILDQRRLPHEVVVEDLRTVSDAAIAIRDMHVRGAPLIGATAAYGMYLATLEAPTDESLPLFLTQAGHLLKSTRPTAVDLFYAVDRVLERLPVEVERSAWATYALGVAEEIADESARQCLEIGRHGLYLIEALSVQKGGAPVHILTHCNAGWLACIDYGTATAPIYLAHERGLPVHVWVDETRPRNQGARITAFELAQQGVPHTVITDNAGGLLMQRGLVDLVIVGTDRTTARGDVANKIGTYLKALAAQANGVPFYVAAPSPSIDFTIFDGQAEIVIEERNPDEVHWVDGWTGEGWGAVRITPEGSPAANFGFDITPAHLVTGLITERGICPASEAGLRSLFPEKYG